MNKNNDDVNAEKVLEVESEPTTASVPDEDLGLSPNISAPDKESHAAKGSTSKSLGYTNMGEKIFKNVDPTADLFKGFNAANIFKDLNPTADVLKGLNLNVANIFKDLNPTADVLKGLNFNVANILKDLNPNADLLKSIKFNQNDKLFDSILGNARAASNNLTAARSLSYPTLKNVDLERVTAYSQEMTSFSSYFEQWESVVDSFEGFQDACRKINMNNPGFSFLWRGQRNADWPLHSSLYRYLWSLKKVQSPAEPHREMEPFPTEEEMAGAEQTILNHVRNHWRFEDMSALSIFARLQHFGAPTRLMDVSRNPLIAAWFAAEKHEETEDEDCRIFALATGTAPRNEKEKAQQEESSRIGTKDAREYNAFWHLLDSSPVRAENEWGTGRLRRFWIPPMYESRIAAQNAGFVLDGVPLDSPDLDKYFLRPGSPESWKLGDRLASGSIGARFSHPSRKVGKEIAKALPPSFTLRITAKAKHEIRKALEDHYSYTRASIYPDIQGAAYAITNGLKELIENPSN